MLAVSVARRDEEEDQMEGKKKKKKDMADGLTCFTCPIFTPFGNKDSCILHLFSCFFTCGTHEIHLLCGQIRSYHIYGVKTLFHTMV